LKYYRDLKNVTDIAFFEGIVEGFELGKEETTYELAKNMKKEGIPIPIIAKITGLSENDIKKL
jgi:predicted transposase/invertase (TIGR01784 family)